MTRNETLLSVLSIASFCAVGGCYSEPPPFDPMRIERIQRQGAYDPASRERVPATLPTAIERAMDDKGNYTRGDRNVPLDKDNAPPLRMSLQEMVHRAVANNSEVRVTAYQSSIDALRITEAEARFDPTFFFNAITRRDYPQGIGGGQLKPLDIENYNAETGIQQQLANGGQAKLSYTVNRTPQLKRASGDPLNPIVQPTFIETDLQLEYTQPILRDFGEDVNRARIVIAQNDQKISQLDFRLKLESTLVGSERSPGVEQAYWELWKWHQFYLVEVKHLEARTKTLEDTIKRVGFDATEKGDVAELRATVESTRVDILRWQRQIQAQSTLLKTLMNDPEIPASDPRIIYPTDNPTQEGIVLDPADQIVTALRNRADLRQQMLRIDSAAVVVRAAHNNELPKLDLIFQMGLKGLGNAMRESVYSQGNTDFITYGFGFNFEVPMGNRGAIAISRRTQLQRLQAIEQYRGLADAAAGEVREQLNEIDSAYETMIAAKRTSFAYYDAWDSYRELLLLDRRDPIKLRHLIDLYDEYKRAQQTEFEAIARFNIALARLELAKGTALQFFNVTLREGRGPASAAAADIPANYKP